MSTIKTNKLENLAGTHSVPVIALASQAGVMFDFGGANAPGGALACNGQQVAIADYPELYAAIGDIWNNTGGASNPSAGNFRVPLSEISGVGVFTKGKTSSDNVGDSQTNQNKAHTHTANHNHTASSNSTGAHTHNVTASNREGKGTGGGNTIDHASLSTTSFGAAAASAGAHSHTITVNTKTLNTGSNGGTEARPQNITVLKCIWTGKAE